MNIGIISSGNENLLLFKYLNQYNHNYTIYYDQNNSFLGDKDFEFAKKKITKGIDYLRKEGCEKIIIDPIFELNISQEKEYKNILLPVFTKYLHDYCFSQSLIGKIGVLGDFASIQKAQSIIKDEEKKYQLTNNQKNIKNFHFPFKYWIKEVKMRKYFLNKLSFSNYMVNKVIKFDLRYFKNANVDTIIPLNYGYFAYQRVINKYFNSNRQKFHNGKKIAKILNNLLKDNQEKKYDINILANGHTEYLHENKYILRLLQKGQETKIKYL